MAKNKEANDHELALARALFRSDKWDPARDPDLPFVWEDLRAEYLKRAKRLLRIFEKDGIVMQAPPEQLA